MHETDIEDESFEGQKEDYNMGNLTKPQIERLKLKKQIESFHLHLNYYYFLVQQNRQVIERLVKKLQGKKQRHTHLKKTLNKFLKGQITTFNILPEESLKDVLSFIKENIQQSKAQMNQHQKKFYQSVLDDNKKLSESIKKKWNVLSEWTIQRLINLDMLSIFFQLSLPYASYCKNGAFLITRDARTYLFDFERYQTYKLLKIYKSSQKFLRQFDNKPIRELASIYLLMMVRNRMYFIVQRVGKKAIASYQYKNLNMLIHLKEEKPNVAIYNFCQIAFWSTEKEVKQQPYAKKYQILKQLLQANRQRQVKDFFKAVLFTKIRFGITLDSMFKLQNLIVQSRYRDIRQLISSFKPSKTAELQATFPYIFIKDETFDVAFQKSGLSKKYDLKNFDRLFVSKMQSVFTFARVVYRQNRQLAVLLANMLKCEQNHKNQLIIIKKMVVSYYETTGCSQLVRQAPKQDLNCNLILIASKDKILACCVVREPLKDQKYMRILKQMMKKMSFHPQSVVVLYQNQFGQSLQWRYIYRFHNHVSKKYNFRLYVINAPLFCSLTMLIFSYIRMKILDRRLSITKQNFYEIVEAQMVQNIQFLQSMMTPGEQK